MGRGLDNIAYNDYITYTYNLLEVTEWQQFRAPDFDLIKRSLSQPVIFDGRNMYNPRRLSKEGITYYSIGRQN